jgi:general stress protein 26
MKTKDFNKQNKGIQKMREMIKGHRVFMMATHLEKIPFSVCPMTLQEMDAQGDLWFFTPKNSDHFKDIENDNRVQLILANEQEHLYLSIFGNATHMVDEAKVDQLWSPMLKAWFNGKDDPNLALLNINMETAFYWNQDQSKLVPLYDMGGTTGKDDPSNAGEKGTIVLQNH